LLGGERDDRLPQRLLDNGPGRSGGPDESRRHPVEDQRGLLPGHVDGVQRPPREAAIVSVHGEQRRTLVGLRHDEDEVRNDAVEDERLAAVEDVPVAGSAGAGLEAIGAPAAVVLWHRERRDGGARCDAGQQLALRRGVAAGPERVHREDGGRKIWRAQKHAPHLLEHDELLDGTTARTAELLGNRQSLKAELLRHLRPDGAVVPLLGLHQPPDLARRRLLFEEPAQATPELLVLLGERERHDASCPSRACVPTSSWRNGTSREKSGSGGNPSTRSPMIERWI